MMKMQMGCYGVPEHLRMRRKMTHLCPRHGQGRRFEWTPPQRSSGISLALSLRRNGELMRKEGSA